MKELIDRLSECDPNKPIWLDYGGTIMPAGYVDEREDRVDIE